MRHSGYEVFKPFLEHNQAVAITRHKIWGSADAVLASFNTVLNFKAIIDRLDFTYADKKPIQVIQQELNLMQGDMPLAKYYDEVEKN